MGMKILFTGLTFILALEQWVPEAKLVGAVLMVLGLVLMWLDR